MQKEKTKVYTYTRVSTAMQVDGYSLDAQKAKMKAYADYNDYKIVGEYEDAGKFGKSIEGREMCIRDRSSDALASLKGLFEFVQWIDYCYGSDYQERVFDE